MRRISFSSESGVILPIVIILMIALIITGIAFLNAAVMENRLVQREVHKNQAFWLAEAGLERALWDLKQDFVNGSEDWTGSDINGVAVIEVGENYWGLKYGQYDRGEGDPRPYEGDLDGGSYVVKLQYINDGAGGYKKDEIWVKSTGTVKDIPRTVQMYVSIANISPWNNAIFANCGTLVEAVIEGNVRIHGSVHILGKGLDENKLAIDMVGTAGIRNNYEGMPAELEAIIPDLVSRGYDYDLDGVNDESVKSLEAVLRVQAGQVGLSGTATAGQEHVSGNEFKETLDGAYVTHEYTGNKGAINVYADREDDYDLEENSVPFPSLWEAHGDFGTYWEFLNSLSLYPGGVGRVEIPGNKISSEHLWGERGVAGIGTINWWLDPSLGKPVLDVNGVVWVDGTSLDIGEKDKTIEYRGSGVIVVAYDLNEPAGPECPIPGDIRVHGDLLALEGFPGNVLGLVTNRLELATGPGESQIMMTGAFFAEEVIVSEKQNEIGGTFVSDTFDLGQNVPRIYQVPELVKYLPAGMPGEPTCWSLTTSKWSEVSS